MCEVKFNSELELDVHVNTYEVESEHIKCYLCRKKIRKPYLKIHLKMHRDEKTEICEVCNKTFVNKSVLARHMRIHTGDVMSYKCPICNKVCTSLNNMNTHLTVHSDERPFQCSSCSRSFKSEGNLRKHSLIHTEEKRYICTACG